MSRLPNSPYFPYTTTATRLKGVISKGSFSGSIACAFDIVCSSLFAFRLMVKPLSVGENCNVLHECNLTRCNFSNTQFKITYSTHTSFLRSTLFEVLFRLAKIFLVHVFECLPPGLGHKCQKIWVLPSHKLLQ